MQVLCLLSSSETKVIIKRGGKGGRSKLVSTNCRKKHVSTRRKFSMRQGCNEHLKARRTEVQVIEETVKNQKTWSWMTRRRVNDRLWTHEFSSSFSSLHFFFSPSPSLSFSLFFRSLVRFETGSSGSCNIFESSNPTAIWLEQMCHRFVMFRSLGWTIF